MEMNDKEYCQRMAERTRRKMSTIRRSISKSDLETLLTDASYHGWLNEAPIQKCFCILEKSGPDRTVDEFFREFRARTNQLPMLCSYLWDFNDNLAMLIDEEERFRARPEEKSDERPSVNRVSSTSYEATDEPANVPVLQLPPYPVEERKRAFHMILEEEIGECVKTDEDLTKVKNYVLIIYDEAVRRKDIESAETWSEVYRTLHMITAWDMNDIGGLLKLINDVEIFREKKDLLQKRLHDFEKLYKQK